MAGYVVAELVPAGHRRRAGLGTSGVESNHNPGRGTRCGGRLDIPVSCLTMRSASSSVLVVGGLTAGIEEAIPLAGNTAPLGQ